MSNPFFIDENITIFTGDQAVKKLNEENDQQYFKSGEGVAVVSEERWRKAQACEKNHWFVRGIKTSDDRNYYHARNFNNYSDLKDKTFNSVLEIGCGPFTNARVIAKFCNIKNVTLLDPMVLDYLKHPFCSYDKNYLYSQYSVILGKVIRKFFPFAFKPYRSLLSRKTKIVQLLNIPAEKIAGTEEYDLVIMVNVIEHCYNADTLFQNILNITASGSYLIFEDKLFENNEIKKALRNSYDAAHPLKVDKEMIDGFLSKHFTTVYKRVQSNSDFYAGEEHPSEDLYYIGKRK